VDGRAIWFCEDLHPENPEYNPSDARCAPVYHSFNILGLEKDAISVQSEHGEEEAEPDLDLGPAACACSSPASQLPLDAGHMAPTTSEMASACDSPSLAMRIREVNARLHAIKCMSEGHDEKARGFRQLLREWLPVHHQGQEEVAEGVFAYVKQWRCAVGMQEALPGGAVQLPLPTDVPRISLSLRGINLQEQWATLMYAASKTQECRTFPTGNYADELLWLIETPDKPKSRRQHAEITGTVRFRTSFQHRAFEEFRRDEGLHCIREGSRFDWRSGDMHAWLVAEIHQLAQPVEAPEIRGMVGSRQVTRSVTYAEWTSPANPSAPLQPSAVLPQLRATPPTALPLLPHQIEVAQMVRDHTRVLVLHPTGSGKTRSMLACLDDAYSAPTAKLVILPNYHVCLNFYAELLRWPGAWRDFFSFRHPVQAAVAAGGEAGDDWQFKRFAEWTVPASALEELVAIARDAVGLKGKIAGGALSAKFVAECKTIGVSPPSGPLRALTYNAAGGAVAAVDESDEALAAVMKFNYSKPNVYSGKFVLVDEAHNLLRPCAPAVKQLKGLLARAADLTIAAFTATPIVQRASDLQELAQLVGANAMPAVSTLAQHLDHYPRVAPLGCLDGSVLIDAPESIVTCTPLRGRLQDRYVHAL
jgi:hypothetical protein